MTADATGDDDGLDFARLMEAIAERYEADERLRIVAGAELPALERTLSALLPQLSTRYVAEAAFKPGGGGVPILLRDTALRNQRCVLKLPRPVTGREHELNRILHQESLQLITVRHPHVIRILAADEAEGVGTPYYIMEHVPDARDADDYLAEHPSVDSLLEILRGAVAALAHVHSLNVIHTDVKPANLFVDSSGRTLLADFGFAKRVDAGESQTSLVGGTRGYMHPEQVTLLSEVSGNGAEEDDPLHQVRRAPLDRSLIKPYWDLYSLGVTFFVLLQVLENERPRSRTDYRVRYLRLMAYRLVGENLQFAKNNSHHIRPQPRIGDTVFGLETSDIHELQYTSMQEVDSDIKKLLGTEDLSRLVPEISRHQVDVIQASSLGPVPFTARVRKIIDTPEVRQLGTVSQLGLVAMVYPTATHTRLEHTLGTFAMACRFVRALYNDPVNPIFKQVMRPKDVEALLLGCLVHDIGHYPLAHDLEETEPRIFSHELRTEHLLTSRTGAIGRVLSDPESGWTAGLDDVRKVLRAGVAPERATFRDSVLSAVLSGPIDADKLDYLIRDGENLRLPYGRGIDFDRLISNVTVVMVARRQGRHVVERFPSLGVHERGRMAAESLAFARYAMYGAVYWHRTHRCLKAMLNRAVSEALATRVKEDGSSARSLPADVAKALRGRLFTSLDAPLQARLPLPAEPRKWPDAFFDPGTAATLDWVTALAPARTGKLLTDLKSRSLFERILVAAQDDPSDVPWGLLREVFGPQGERDTKGWIRRLDAVRELELLVAGAVAAWDGQTGPELSIVDPRIADVFQAQVRQRPTLLIDYPTAKPGSKHALSYLHEPEFQDPESDAFRAVAADESPLWKAVAEQLQLSLARLRIYCDPAFAGLIVAAVPRTHLLELLAIALDRVAMGRLTYYEA